MADASHNRAHGRVGTVVRGKYKVDAFLATGTMANVYSATHRNGSRVALKILHKELANDSGLRERFKREGYFANSIGHPGVVRAIDDDTTEDGCAFLVMELLEGETLEERRRRKGGRLPLHQVLSVADTLLEILAAAHAKDVVHRDMKPDNVFVTKTGDVKVLDFGVARWADGKQSSDMTAVGMVLGTPAYMPPEQALGKRESVDAQSDIWAVGATLFVVLSGEQVHEGGDAKAKLIATARTPARPIQDVAPDVPRSVANVIDRALAFEKKKRWPDAHAMREALRWARMSLEGDSPRAAQSEGGDVIPPPVPTRRNMDDEPTMARMAPTGAAAAAAAILDSLPPVSGADVITSAPPITLRDGPKQPHPSVEPVFSLRRTKEGEGGPPETDPLPVPGKASGLAALVHDQDAPPKVKTLPGIAESSPPPPMNPPDAAAGAAVLAVPPDVASAGAAAHVEGQPKSVEVNLSFTRPMAALVMPDIPAPRPAAGEPPPQLAGTMLTGPPPPVLTGPPAPVAATTGETAAVNNAFAASLGATAVMGSASNAYPALAPNADPSSPPHTPSFPAPAPTPAPAGGLAATMPLVGSTPPGPHHLSSAPPNAAYGAPPTPGAVYTSAPPPQATTSIPPDAPGPVLAQIVDRRSNVARLVIALMLGCALLALVLVVVKRRAAAAAAAKAAHPPIVATADPAPPKSGATSPIASGGPSETSSGTPSPNAGSSGAPATPPATASASASVAVAKKPPRKRKPKPPPAASATATTATTATEPPTEPTEPPPAPPEPTSAPTAAPSEPPSAPTE